MSIPFYSDTYGMALYSASRYAAPLVIETEEEVFASDDDLFGTIQRVQITVVQCSMCSNPAQSLSRHDDNPSVCSRRCAGYEDEAVDAAQAAELRRYEG